MRLNEIRDRSVDATLSSDELVLLSNIIYAYQKDHELKEREAELYGQVMAARDLCQYGRIDSFTLRHIVLGRMSSGKDSEMARLAAQLRGMPDEDAPDGSSQP